jgi:biofilm PGA synthesis N-glycosyltransferase PgaC
VGHYIWKDGIRNLIGRRMADPANTRAVAGAILIRNSRQNWLHRKFCAPSTASAMQ